MRVFLSHSSKDAKAAEDICSLIEKNGHKCFLAPRDIRSGYEYAEEIITGIDSSDVVLLVLSEEANSSPHVLREIERAVSKKIAIIVYKLEEVTLSKSMEYFLMTHQWINSKPGADYKEIAACVEEFAARHDGSVDAASDTVKLSPAAESKPKNSKLIIIIAIIAAIICAAGIGTGICIASQDSQPVQNELSSDSNSTDASSSDTASSENESQQTTADTSAPETTPAETESTAAVTENTTPATENTTHTTETTPTESKTTPAVSETDPPVINAELGDTIILGTYNNEPIEWRVLKISEDGKQAIVLADKIISMKAFDACEGGKFNYYDGEYYYSTSAEDVTPEFERLLRGDNRWELSNIRTWLNSDRENVVYNDHPPVATAMCEQKNGYNTEAGFLKSFTKDELSAILTTQVVTNGTTTEDKVFLLSKEEYSWLIDADISKYTTPTEAAVANDGSRWYELNVNDFGITDHYWWLRDADTDTASKVYLVNFSYAGDEIVSECASLEGYGIRPAMTVDLTSSSIVIE